MNNCCAEKRNINRRSLIAGKRAESKVVLLGDSGVGKSSILLRYTKNMFSESFEITVGGAYTKTCVPLGKEAVTLDIWDTAGQERFRSLLPIYFRSAVAALIVYDISDPPSFERCEYWVKTLQDREPQCRLFIIGNKFEDLENSNNVDSLKEYAHKKDIEWILTSAKYNFNIKELFERVATSVKDANSKNSYL